MEFQIEVTFFADKDSAKVIEQKVVYDGEQKANWGAPTIKNYLNSVAGREHIQSVEPENIVAAALSVWGDEITV